MSESIRLQKLLLDLLDRIRHRGTSTKVLWTNFSNGKPLTKDEFERKISTFGLPMKQNDINIIWANIGAQERMGYSEFVYFINMENIDTNKCAQQQAYDDYGPPQTQAQPQQQYYEQRQEPAQQRGSARPTLVSILTQYKQQIVDSILNIDPLYNGFMTAQQLTNCIDRVTAVDPNEVQRLVNNYEPTREGLFNYFSLLADLSNQAGPKSSSSYRTQQNNYAQPTFESSIREDSQYNQYTTDQSNVPHAMEDHFNEPSSGFRSNNQAPSYGNQNQSYQQQPPSYGGGSNIEEIVRDISVKLGQRFDSSSSCYNKWRQYEKTISAQQLVDGCSRDLKMQLSVQDAQRIIDKYGGSLTLGNFSKMLGAGSDTQSVQVAAQLSSEGSDEDKTLMHIARQAKGKDFDNVIDGCNTVEQLVQSLRGMKIYVLLNDVRPAWDKYKKEGIKQRVQMYLSQL